MTERWRPPLTFVVLAVGLLIGLALGISNRASGQSTSIQHHYLLLVSDLYAQGAPLTSVRDRLLSVGYTSPSTAALTAADQIARSSDTVSQREADQLQQFAKALVATPASSTAVVAQPVGQTQAGPTSIAQSPTAVATSVAAVVPMDTATPIPSPSPVPTLAAVVNSPTTVPDVVPPPPAPPTAPPALPTPKATAAPAKPGVILATGEARVVLRSGASSKTTAVASIPNGTKVLVYGSLAGEALTPPEATWYHVVYNGKQGYVYAKQLKVGG